MSFRFSSMMPRGLREGVEGASGPGLVHVAERNDVLALEIVEHPAALAAHAEAGDVQFLAGGCLALAEDVAGDKLKPHYRSGSGLKEASCLMLTGSVDIMVVDLRGID